MDSAQIHLTPAINIREETYAEISDEEFQRKMFRWFEDRGLLAELRSHLRIKMISLLKETALGKKVSSHQPLQQSISPKIQVVDTLIAEFLMQQNCHYTLSVFSTEATFLNILPECIKNTININTLNSVDKTKLSEENVYDLLETLGITKNSDKCRHIIDLYCNKNSNDSLLMCILQSVNNMTLPKQKAHGEAFSVVLPKKLFTVTGRNAGERCISRKTNIFNLIRLLKDSNLEANIVQQVLHYIEIILIAEENYYTIEHKEEITTLKMELKEKISQIDTEWKSKLEELSKSNELEKQLLRDRYEEKEAQYNEILNVKAQIEKTDLERIEETLNLKESLIRHEKSLLQKENEIKDMEKRLKSEHAQMSDLLSQLQQENAHLRALNDEQHEHIKELSQKMSFIQHDMKESQIKLSTLKNPPLKIPSSSSSTSISNEDSEKTEQQKSRPSLRKSKEKFDYFSSDLSSQSPTSLILQETKQRLKSLESESKQIDRQFRSFKNRQLKHQIVLNDTESDDCETFKRTTDEILDDLLKTVRLSKHDSHKTTDDLTKMSSPIVSDSNSNEQNAT